MMELMKLTERVVLPADSSYAYDSFLSTHEPPEMLSAQGDNGEKSRCKTKSTAISLHQPRLETGVVVRLLGSSLGYY